MAQILVVDDDDPVREMICQTLTHHGFEVVDAVNGVAAIQKLHQQHADLIILDIIMPEKGNIETLIEIRRLFPDLKIIATSGGSPRIQVQYNLALASKFGADLVLRKPFEHKFLLDAIDSLIHDRDKTDGTKTE